MSSHQGDPDQADVGAATNPAESLPIATVVDLFPIVTEALKLIAERLDELDSRLRNLEADRAGTAAPGWADVGRRGP